ncbi:transporter major facilitator family protein [Thermosipho africanus H17ap60334]|uniref:MFS transporter n=1 Tax=Thermosipho africanus TaxID=2421 RepID=UPI00028BFEB0|nr:MFS transporter [Thermosipho africanus]EKF49117.1 transporter major facilitator family protein [Thermosipho africanus H17ap60334]
MKEKLINLYGFLNFFTFGFVLVLIGPLIPVIEKSFSINHSLIGLSLSLGSVSFLIGSLVFGFLLEKFNTFNVVLTAGVIFSFGVFILFIMNSFTLFVFGNFMMNFGGAALEVSIPFLIGVSGTGKKAKKLNFLHSAFAIGAVISPIVSSFILRFTNLWRTTFAIGFITSLLPFIFLFLIKNTINEFHSEYVKEQISFKNLINFSLVILILALSLYVSYEMNFSSWISVFLHEVRSYSVSRSAIFPSFLWLGLFIGRLFFAKMPEKFGYKKWLLFVISFSLICSSLSVFLSINFFISSILIFFTGLFYATTYPTIQATIIEKYKSNKGIALSLASSITSLFSGGASYLIGLLGQYFGIFFGFLLILIFNILELMIIIIFKENQIFIEC